MSLLSAGEPNELPKNYRSGDRVAGRGVSCAFFAQREGNRGFADGSQHNQRALSLLQYQGDILSARSGLVMVISRRGQKEVSSIVLIVLVGNWAHGTHVLPYQPHVSLHYARFDVGSI